MNHDWQRITRRCAVIASFTIALVFAACGTPATIPLGPTATATAAATVTPNGPLVTDPLQAIQFVSATAGWGTTRPSSGNNANKLVHSNDGGVSWDNVTPTGYSGNLGSLIFSALSATEVWVGVTNNSVPSSSLWHTINSGTTWQQSTIATSNLNQFVFVDSQHGWISASPNGHGASQYPIDLWRTVDGGTTWNKVTTAPPVPGDTVGVSFLNASTGWTSAQIPGAVLEFTVTHDGGQTWQAQSLASPTAGFAGSDLTAVSPPTFFSSTSGILFVHIYSVATGKQTIPYRTSDSGATWTVGAAVGTGDCHTSVVSSGASFALCAPTAMVNTTDPAQLYTLPASHNTWSAVTVDVASRNLLRDVKVLDMYSENTGWALTGSGLIYTNDGGVTWSLLLADATPGS